MFTLRCTQKLLRRGLAESEGLDQQSTTLLGDWYANIFFSKPQRLVLCVSERTLLPVIVPAKGLKSLAARVPEAICELLLALGISAEAVRIERGNMESCRLGRTASKRALGSLNDLLFQPGIVCTITPSARFLNTHCGLLKYRANPSSTPLRTEPRRHSSFRL